MIPCYNCGRPAAEGTPVCPGCQALLEVSGYRLMGVLGQGGGGAVYQARVLPTAGRGAGRAGQEVALKQTLDARGIQAFGREFAVLRGLQHPNLPRYYALFEAAGRGYLVMEFIPGQNLDDVLTKQPAGLPESQVLGYALQLCAVLSYLHGQTPPILHRDIKPANIRLTPEGRITLVDFGLLKQGTGQTRLSIQGLGTVEYAPLEQYGRGGSTDPRSDLYSLGATLYHLLTGHAPDDAITRVTSATDPLRAPQVYRPDLTPHVAAALLRALALRPEDRFPDVLHMRAALLGLASLPGGVTAALPAGALAPAGVILADLAAPVVTTALPAGATAPRSTPVQGATAALPGIGAGPNPVLKLETPVDSVAFAPDGRVFAAGGANGTVGLWRPTDGRPLGVLATGGGPVYSLAFNPAASLLATGSWAPHGTISLWRVAVGTLQRSLMGYSGEVKGLAFAPNGTILASADADGAVRLWRVVDGILLATLIRYAPGSFHSVFSLAWAPGGQVLAVGGWTTHLWRVAGDAQATVQASLFPTPGQAEIYVHTLAFSPDGQILAAGTGDKLIRLWRVKDWTPLRVLSGHTSFLTSVAFAPDGQTLASAAYDGTIRLWRVSDGASVGVLEGHHDAVSSVAFAPDGHLLASGSWDKTVRFWEMS